MSLLEAEGRAKEMCRRWMQRKKNEEKEVILLCSEIVRAVRSHDERYTARFLLFMNIVTIRVSRREYWNEGRAMSITKMKSILHFGPKDHTLVMCRMTAQ